MGGGYATGVAVTDDLTVRPWGTGGYGGSAYRLPSPDLPPEPDAPALVRLAAWHPVFGSDALFERLVRGWLPCNWTPQRPFTWAELCRWNGGRPPTLLGPVSAREVAP